MSEPSMDGFVSEETCESDLSIGLSPQENVRLEVLHEHLDQYIRLIKELVPLVQTESLFNIDESGFSDWEEHKPKCVLIPTEARETTLHYPASPKIRHQTLVCCVTAARDAYYPLLGSSDLSIRFMTESIFKSRLVLRPMRMLRYLKDILIQF
jgi:hypothetical protein